MPWRLAGPGDDLRYAIICPRCRRQRGWRIRATAEAHLSGLVKAGWRLAGFGVEEYEAGTDYTCEGCELGV